MEGNGRWRNEMTKMNMRVIVVVATLTLAASACGGDSEPERDQALVDALSSEILSDGDGFTTDQAEADCVAEGTYDAIGADRLAEVGITVDSPDPSAADLTEAEIDELVDAVFGCVDMKASFAASIAGDDLSEDDATCIADELGDDGLKELTKQGLSADEDIITEEFIALITSAAEACEVPIS